MADWFSASATDSRSLWRRVSCPGTLFHNSGLRFICQELELRVETTKSPFSSALKKDQILHLPIAHGEGQYFADKQTLDELESEDRVAFRYMDNPEWLSPCDRRHSEPGAKCSGNDAAPGTRMRPADGFHGWCRRL